MPAKNSLKIYAPNQYYHVYNRGVAKQPIFLDAEDKKKFLSILARHLDASNGEQRYDGVVYEKFPDLELLCFCLMGNHFHLLFYVGDDETTLKRCLQQACTAYSMYFNKKYKRVGPVFQGVSKASMILNNAYLLHITRYIHMNPRRYQTYYYSSLRFYLGKIEPPWLRPRRAKELFGSTEKYRLFLEDYEGVQATLGTVKNELAHE